MAAGLDLEDRLGGDLGATVAVPGGQLGQSGQHVELGQDSARLDQARGFGRDPVAQGREQLVFELEGALLGPGDLVLVFLELGGDVALGVLDGLLADVVAGDAPALGLGLGVRDLDVVAEDLVVSDLEALDSGPANLVGLKLGDPRLTPLGVRTQLVELRVVAVADQAAFLDGQRRVVVEGRFDLGPDLGTELERGLELVEPL